MTNLTRESNYQFPPTPEPAMLSRDAWNYVLGSISGRLGALEEQRTDLDDLMADLSFTAQVRVDAAVTPLIEAVEYRINGMTGQLDELQETVNSILAGGIPAENVTESPTRRFWTPDDMAALALGLASKADAAATASALADKPDHSDIVSAVAAEVSARKAAVAAAIPVGTIVAAVSRPGLDWLPCDGAAYLKDAYPALAENVGLILNGINRSPVPSTPVINGASAIKKIGGEWFATTDNGVFRSSNRHVWTSAFTETGFSWQPLAFGNGRLMLTSRATARTYTSTDNGLTWVQMSNQVKATALGYGLGAFVAVGEAGSIKTNIGDGSWVTRASGVTVNLLAVLGRPNRVIACGNSNPILYSDDLVTWHAASAPAGDYYWLHDDGERLFAGRQDGMAQSVDGGKTWTMVPFPVSAQMAFITKILDVYIAGSFAASGGRYFSRDLQNWVPISTLPAISAAISEGKVLTVIEGGAIKNLDVVTYNPETEFSVPNLAEKMGPAPIEQTDRYRWIRALAA